MREIDRRAAFGATIALGAVATGSAVAEDGKERRAPGEFPVAWDLDAISRAMPGGDAIGLVSVLAWKIVETDRSLRIESCLALKKFEREQADGAWVLTGLYRHPREKDRNEWREIFITVSRKDGGGGFLRCVRWFKAKPDNLTIYESLDPLLWSFKLKNESKIVGCGICESQWKEALGESPTRFFEC